LSCHSSAVCTLISSQTLVQPDLRTRIHDLLTTTARQSMTSYAQGPRGRLTSARGRQRPNILSLEGYTNRDSNRILPERGMQVACAPTMHPCIHACRNPCLDACYHIGMHHDIGMGEFFQLFIYIVYARTYTGAAIQRLLQGK